MTNPPPSKAAGCWSVTAAVSSGIALVLSVAAIYYAKGVETHFGVVHVIPLNVNMKGQSESCFSHQNCRRSTRDLYGVVRFQNRGDAPAQDVSIYLTVGNWSCEGDLGGDTRTTNKSPILQQSFLGQQHTLDAFMSTALDPGYMDRQTIHYCVTRRGNLPFVWDYTKGRIDLEAFVTEPQVRLRFYNRPFNLENETPIAITSETNDEEGRTFSPETICRQPPPVRRCEAQTVTLSVPPSGPPPTQAEQEAALAEFIRLIEGLGEEMDNNARARSAR